MKSINLSYFFLSIIVLNLVYGALLSITNNYPNSFSHFKWLINHEEKYHDSWHTMTSAINYYLDDPEESIYGVFFEDGIKFQYPPTSLLLFDIPERLFGFTDYQIIKSLDLLSLTLVFLMAYFSWRILSLILKKNIFLDNDVGFTQKRIWQFSLVLVLTLFFYPLIWSYHIGQIQTFLTFLATLSIFLWLSSKKLVAGALIGLACLFKPQIGALIVWAIIRRQWGFVQGAVAMIALGLTVSVYFYGLDNHLDYLQVLSFLSRHGESYYPNQSINGLLNRLLFNGENLEWNGDGFPPYSTFVHISTLVSSIFILSLGLFWNYKRKSPSATDYSIILLCTTMASPIAWEHHFAILLPIFFILSPYVCLYYAHKRYLVLAFILSFVLASQFLKPVNHLADTHYNPLQSYLFFSALVFLVSLFRVSKQQRTDDLTRQ